LTERFVKVQNQQQIQIKNQPFESIKEVEESFVSEDSSDSIITTETPTAPFPQPMYLELKPGEISVFNSAKII